MQTRSSPVTPTRRTPARFTSWVWAFALAGGAMASEPQRPVKTVGFVFDGPPAGAVAGPGSLQGLAELIRRETLLLTERDFDVRFPEDKQVSFDWSVEAIKSGVDRMLADPEVDVIVALGVFTGNEVCRRRDLPKPVLAPIAVDVAAQGLPTAIDDTGRVVSGVPNLSYTVLEGSILRDVQAFRELVPFDRLHVVAEDLIGQAIPEIAEVNIAASRQLGVELVLVPASGTAESVLRQLDDDAEAVYLTPLLRLGDEEFERLVQGLVQRGLPSFSLSGRPDVERGIMAGVRPTTDRVRSARRVALKLQRILLGEDPATFPVKLDLVERLVINQRTARAVGVFVRWRTRIEADLLHDDADRPGRSLTFFEAVDEAMRTNLTLAVADRSVAAGRQIVAGARSALGPRVVVQATALEVDRNTAEQSFGNQAQSTIVGGLSATQVLYSEPLRAGVAVEESLQQARVQDRRTRMLDVALAAARAFLDVLRATTLERIARENLDLTESNLELARRRERLGVSSPAEVYRWESEIATDRSEVIASLNRTDAARVALNQVLHRPLEERTTPVPPDPEDPRLITCCQRLDAFVDSPERFRVFREFSVAEALTNSTELAALDERIAAAERRRLAARRAFRFPELTVSGALERDVLRDGAGSGPTPLGGVPDRDSWNLALSAGFPLYAGGARQAEARLATEQLAGLRLERAVLVEQIETRVLQAMFGAGASFPAIEFSQEAAEAAGKNLELVTDAYSRGVVSILDLLDAQNAALVAEQVAANSIYDFLLDLVEIERATSTLEFFSSAAGREDWFQRLGEHFERAGMPVLQEEQR